MKIGFSGTRHKLPPDRIEKLKNLLIKLDPTEFHHGDCVGADEQASNLVKSLWTSVDIIVHPPDKDSLRAFTSGTLIHPPQSYFDRNMNIVDASDIIICMPGKDSRGTHHVHRYARAKNKIIYINKP